MNTQLFSSIIFIALLTSHSGKAQDYQLPYSSADTPGTAAFFARSVFSNGISGFFTDVFNHQAYAEGFLPGNFFHMIELFQHGNKTGKDRLYVRSVFRLFSNKIKACSYINAYSFADLLSQFPALLQSYFTVSSDCAVTSLKDIIYEIQYQTFKTQFPEFKASPETFLTNLSQHIEDAAELRKMVMLFLEISLNKLVWSPEDQFDTWQCAKLIADQLSALYRRSIIADLDDLNSLYITLLERYCLFLDIGGSHIDIMTFEKIKQDIHSSRIALLELPEQEDLLETKLHHFMNVLSRLEAKARAREQGMIV